MAGVSRIQRELGWNVKLFLGAGIDSSFAGFYQLDNYLSVGDVCHDIDLCYLPPIHGESRALLPRDGGLIIVLDVTDTTPFPTPPPTSSHDYFYVFHDPACADKTQPHNRDSPCVVIAPRPEPRFDDRYLAIGCQPEDNVLRTVPLRAKKRSRTPSPKRSTSYDRSIDDNDDFPNAIISEADARPWIDGFRNSILMTGQTKCAISGKRGAWWSNGGMGMVVEAVHIIPQIHWCKFPDPKQNISAPDDLNALRDSWQATWHTSNGLLLYVHIHRLFDARLISIEPTTKRIRVFMPCDSLTEYQGKYAFLPEGVNLNALQHHYDMCCIENMAAKRPPLPPSLQINKRSQPILAAASQMPSPKGDPSKSQLPLPTRNSKGQDETLKNNSDSPQERTDLPPRPPPSEPGTTVRLWRSGGLLLTNEQEVDQMRQKGWLVYAVDRDEDEDEEDEDENVEEEEEEERGRSRKRLRRTIS